nr:hypothetical protein [Victivallaceae bacterium]
TLGIKNEQGFEAINMTAFGEPKENNADKVGFFTGKPYIGELGYAFLFRNYRADQGKWQTKDPLGYPDGWNNLAYVNNGVTSYIDWLGAYTKTITETVAVAEPTYGTTTSRWFSLDPSTNMNIYINTTKVYTLSRTVTTTYEYDTTLSDQSWANLSLCFQGGTFASCTALAIFAPEIALPLGIVLGAAGLTLTITDHIYGDTLVGISMSTGSSTFTKTTYKTTYSFYPIAE